MDDKTLNKDPQENNPDRPENLQEDTAPAAGAHNQAAEPDGTEGAGEREKDKAWDFDAQVQTDLSNINLSYSGKEIEIVAPLMKEDTPPDNDVITFSKTKMKKIFRIVWIAILGVIAAAVLAAGITFGFFIPNNFELMTPVNTAVKVDGTSLSVGAYNYYYNSFTSSSALSGYVSNYGLDTSVDYDKQYYDESTGETWADYFEKNTLEELKYVTYYYNCAKDAGMKLSKEEKKQLDESMDSVAETATTAGKSVSAYLEENYGEHVGMKTIRKMQELRYLAQKYVQQLSITERVTPEEVAQYETEHPEEISVASFRYLPIPFTQSNKEEMRAKSEELKGKLTDTATFTATAKPYAEAEYQEYITDDYTLIPNITSTNEQIPGAIREWLFTNGVQVNDVTVVEDEAQSCFYVIMMEKAPHFNEEKLFSVRHLLVKVASDKDADGKAVAPTEAQWNTCKETAQKYLDEFNQTDKSELSFASLAEKYSEDTASLSKSGDGTSFGGLLAQSKQGQMVAPFESWSIDPARNYGDVGMVQTEYGYHLIYFISNQEAWRYTAEVSILGQKQDAKVEKLDVNKKMGFKNRTVAKPATEETTTKAASK